MPPSPDLAALLGGDVLDVAPRLLGAVLRHGEVAVRLTEVEAYDGADDPGSHAHRGRTPRNAVMFGPPGRVYVYFTYGMHWCMNLVCGPAGTASAVLLRAGEVVEGQELAQARRTTSRSARDLARGPGRLTKALGVDGGLDGTDATRPRSPLVVSARPDVERSGPVASGPRVGVAGDGAGHPWRFWLEGEPSVSPYRAAVLRRRPAARSGRLGS
ncbi:MAG TPA: DNA-3-methyladenine glycosylase [Lapillicoccus sp.]|nr:DNA-3-methyladenine glycosylase [Lapillicoccus sp.]